MNIPKSHPRYASLKTRERLVEGTKVGVTSLNGLIAQGRGEAFDYLFGEMTHSFARKAIREAALLLYQAKRPVISVNGNSAVLSTSDLVTIAGMLNAPLEINLFHSDPSRLQKTKQYLQAHGAKHILLPYKTCVMPFLESDRKYVNPEGIAKADVVLVPLEDGDRTEALVKNGKTVITVDLNPLSRTAQKATVTIVDNITRALTVLIEEIKKLQTGQGLPKQSGFSNKKILKEATDFIGKKYSGK